jgi:hypothetical protein
MNKSVFAGASQMLIALFRMLYELFAGAEDTISMGRNAIAEAKGEQQVRIAFKRKEFEANIIADTAIANVKSKQRILDYAKSNPEMAQALEGERASLQNIVDSIRTEEELKHKVAA